MLFPFHHVLANRDLEGRLNLRRGPGKFNHASALADVVNAKSVRGEPSGDGLDISVSRAKPTTEFFGREPLVIVGRRFVLLFLEQLREGGVALGTVLEDKQHAFQRKIRRSGAAIKFAACERIGISREANSAT